MKLKQIGHSSCQKGKKVIIKTYGGKTIIDKFLETKSSVIILEEYGRLPKKGVRFLGIYKKGGENR